jgi:hypothetical protein
MKLSKKIIQAMGMSLAVGATVAVTSCASLKENVEVSPDGKNCTISCGENCTDHKGQTIDYCPLCGRG